MVICVAVDCENDSRQGGYKFLYISKGRRSESVMANKKLRDIQSIQQASTCHVYCFG